MALITRISRSTTWANSFQHRDFRLLWGATFLQSLGMGMEHVSLGWLVFELTDSPFMVGVSSAARMAPFFFLGLLSGAIADRVDRRIFLRFITLGGVVVAGAMALVILTGVVQVWHVIALSVGMGCVWAFTMTIRQAYTYDIVGPQHALNGLALTGMGQQFGGVFGAIIGGLAISTMGVGDQYLIVSVSYAAAVAVLLATRDPGQAGTLQRESVVRNLVGYVELLRYNRTLMILMILTATTEILGFTHMTLLPVFAKDVLGVGALGLGFMTAARQAGGMLGVMLLATLGDYRRKGALMFVISAAFGLGLMAFYLANNIFVFMVVLAFVNACAMSVDTLYKTLMQSNVPNEQRGRAMGSWVFSIGVAPAGHLGIGGLAGALGAQGALLVNGAALALVSVASAIGLPRIRRLE